MGWRTRGTLYARRPGWCLEHRTVEGRLAEDEAGAPRPTEAGAEALGLDAPSTRGVRQRTDPEERRGSVTHAEGGCQLPGRRGTCSPRGPETPRVTVAREVVPGLGEQPAS